MLAPALMAVSPSVIETFKSGVATMLLLNVAVLLALFVSPLAETVAVLTSVLDVPAGRLFIFTLTWRRTVAFEANEKEGHVTRVELEVG